VAADGVSENSGQAFVRKALTAISAGMLIVFFVLSSMYGRCRRSTLPYLEFNRVYNDVSAKIGQNPSLMRISKPGSI